MNKEENKYILYRHIRPDKDEVFYIGIGESGRDTDFKWGRNKHWRGIYNQNNKEIDVEILFEDLSWTEACEKEIWWIAFYGRSDLGLGTLCNMTDGGEGGAGRKKSPETIVKFKETMGKQPHPMKNKTHTPEARKKISEAGKRPMHQNTKSALQKANKEKTPSQKQLKALDRTGIVPANAIKIKNTLTGEVYNSMREASVAYGKCLITFKKYFNSSSNTIFEIYTKDI